VAAAAAWRRTVWKARRVRFVFEGLELDPAAFELRRDGVAIPMEPQVFDVLCYLVQHRDRVVPKEELMDGLWGGRFVSESAVTSRIKQARRALGDDGQAQRMIKTLHGRGYRFVGPVSEAEDRASAVVPEAMPTPALPRPRAVHYTSSDGLSIAYQTSGSGDRDLVLVSGFVSHLDHDWLDPRHAHFLDRLGGLGRLIRFDKRGSGMSDRPSGVPDLETRMHDVLAVMDAAGSQKAALLGYSEGGPMSVLFAATHPERVGALVLYGAYARRVWAPDYPWAQTAEQRAAFADRLVTGWDWEADMRYRCPSADDAMTRWWSARARAAATPSTVRALMSMNDLVDVRNALHAVRVPTLVIHRRQDAVVSLGNGRYLAEHIPHAQLVELDGADHFVSGNPDQILEPIERFLAASASDTDVPLVLAAIVAARGQGSHLLRSLSPTGARLRRTADGDHDVALFDGPATAVRAGLRLLRDRRDVALGLHVAEVSRDAERIGGQGVSSVVALAQVTPPGAMWTSGTVRDLLAGSGVELAPVGVREFGTSGPQPVYSASAR
jgi:pimeloyl-ACP methyl ester carboxylesterase/DNA-binding winged helix-turn-helix (wHTH) protein